ncbi:hypothetical protein HDU96_004082 [Phlyctochytrium bullatum]|nr:hypothetical protein HDU96_004082 [Phlyctochytrium bullatum]
MGSASVSFQEHFNPDASPLAFITVQEVRGADLSLIGTFSLEVQLQIEHEDSKTLPQSTVELKRWYGGAKAARLSQVEDDDNDNGYGKIMLARSLIELDHADMFETDAVGKRDEHAILYNGETKSDMKQEVNLSYGDMFESESIPSADFTSKPLENGGKYQKQARAKLDEPNTLLTDDPARKSAALEASSSQNIIREDTSRSICWRHSPFEALVYSKAKAYDTRIDNYFQMTSWSRIVIELYRAYVPSDNPIHENPENMFTDKDHRKNLSDMVAYVLIPLGDFTVVPPNQAGKPISIKNSRLTFVDGFKSLAGVEKISLPLQITVSESWTVTPTGVPSSERRKIVKDFDFLEVEGMKEETARPERQRLIDRLLKELSDRTEAVKKIGQDLFLSRERNAILEKKIKELEQVIQQKELKLVQLINTVDIDTIPHENLKRKYVMLAERLKEEMKRSKELDEKLKQIDAVNLASADKDKQLKDLQDAHVAQQAYVQKLQVFKSHMLYSNGPDIAGKSWKV